VYSLKKWVELTRANSLLNDSVNLAELFHPEIFLNALRQKFARKLNLPLNELKLASSFEMDTLKSSLIVKIKHLSLQGCSLSHGKLEDGSQELPEFI